MRIMLLVLLLIGSRSLFCQVNGDYRTRSTGLWTTASRWQVFYNGAWRNLESATAGPYLNVIPSSASGEITIIHTIRISGEENANQVKILNTARITVYGGAKLTIIDDLTNPPLVVLSGGLLEIVGTLDLQTQLSATPCDVYGAVESTGNIQLSNSELLIFHSGSVYQHGNNSGGSIPLAKWDTNSTCIISGLSLANPVPPANLNQEFGHFTWNTLSFGLQNVTPFSLGGSLQTVRGNLTIMSTGLNNPRVLRFDLGSDGYNLSVGGDFIIQNGLVTLAQSHTTPTNISIGGDFKISGGSVTFGVTNGFPVNILLKGQLQKTGGTMTCGTGTGSCVILPYAVAGN